METIRIMKKIPPNEGPLSLGHAKILSMYLEWNIINFSKICFGKPQNSPVYVILRDQKFRLQVMVDELRVGHHLYMQLLDARSSFVVKCKIRMKGGNAQGQPLFEKNVRFKINDHQQFICGFKFDSSRSEYAIEDSLTLLCNFSVVLDKTSQNRTTQTVPDMFQDPISNKLLNTLSSDFERFYSKQNYTDFSLNIGDSNFLVHRQVLAARSEFFTAMFRRYGLQKSNCVTDIPNLEQQISSIVLHYVYTGKYPGLTSDTAAPIFSAAHEFALHPLKQLSMQYLLNNLTVRNITAAIRVAEAHTLIELQDQIAKFIHDNWKDVINNPSWTLISPLDHVYMMKAFPPR